MSFLSIYCSSVQQSQTGPLVRELVCPHTFQDFFILHQAILHTLKIQVDISKCPVWPWAAITVRNVWHWLWLELHSTASFLTYEPLLITIHYFILWNFIYKYIYKKINKEGKGGGLCQNKVNWITFYLN